MVPHLREDGQHGGQRHLPVTGQVIDEQNLFPMVVPFFSRFAVLADRMVPITKEKARNTLNAQRISCFSGRGKATRTLDTRFWSGCGKIISDNATSKYSRCWTVQGFEKQGPIVFDALLML